MKPAQRVIITMEDKSFGGALLWRTDKQAGMWLVLLDEPRRMHDDSHGDCLVRRTVIHESLMRAEER